jgi:hypothetical protein
MGEKRKMKIKPSKELCEKTNEAIDKVGDAVKDSFEGIYYEMVNQAFDYLCEYFGKTTQKLKDKITEKGKSDDE